MAQFPPPDPTPAPYEPPKTGAGGAAPSETSGKAIASLVCSIVGLMVCMFVGQIIGIVLGHIALNDIRASQGHLTGEGLAKAGIIVGWIGIAIDVAIVIGWFLMMLVWFSFAI